MKTIGRGGIEIIKRFEGLRLEPYNCPAGHATIGYGHLIHRGPVTDSDKIYWQNFTEAKALELLFCDVQQFCKWVNTAVKIQLTQNQFDAVVSWVYNLGPTAIAGSQTLKALNAGQYELFAEKLLTWNKAGGKVLPGLVARRKAEHDLFLTPDNVGAK